MALPCPAPLQDPDTMWSMPLAWALAQWMTHGGWDILDYVKCWMLEDVNRLLILKNKFQLLEELKHNTNPSKF